MLVEEGTRLQGRRGATPRARRSAAGEQGLEPLRVHERGEVDVESGGQRPAPVLDLAVTRDRDEEDVGPGHLLADQPGQPVPVETRQPDVDERDVRTERLEPMQSARP